MENIDFLTLFQGFGTMMAGGWVLGWVLLIAVRFLCREED